MIDPAQRTHYSSTSTDLISGTGRPQSQKSQSFTAALSNELSEKTALDRDTKDLPSNFPVGQQNVTRRDSVATTASTAPATANTASQASGPSEFVFPTANATPVTTTSSTTSSTTSNSTTGTGSTTSTTSSPASFDEAYWAQQPAPVQQLRNIQDPTERAELATQLADEGYSIDVPIMVWGWDPQITTQARESMGYTWVPSALQQPVEVAPGLTFNGATYNASNPPAGSITV